MFSVNGYFVNHHFFEIRTPVFHTFKKIIYVNKIIILKNDVMVLISIIMLKMCVS